MTAARPMNGVHLNRRGEFTPLEITQLLNAASHSVVKFRGLAGVERRMLYRVALGTGFRAKELSALTPDSFDLEGRPPAAILPAESTKNRKGAVQPLAADLVVELRAYLAGRPRKTPLWPGKWVDRSADMLRVDLDAAGILAKVDGLEGDEVRDFHALRNCFISDVLRTGADLKQAMTLARHSDPRLTASRYARTRLHDLGAVVDKLPKAGRQEETVEPVTLRMTGTDGRHTREQQGAATGAATGDSGRVRLRTNEQSDPSGDEVAKTSQPSKTQGFESERGLLKTIEAERAGLS